MAIAASQVLPSFNSPSEVTQNILSAFGAHHHRGRDRLLGLTENAARCAVGDLRGVEGRFGRHAFHAS